MADDKKLPAGWGSDDDEDEVNVFNSDDDDDEDPAWGGSSSPFKKSTIHRRTYQKIILIDLTLRQFRLLAVFLL